jgi:hypothetical protein
MCVNLIEQTSRFNYCFVLPTASVDNGLCIIFLFGTENLVTGGCMIYLRRR